MLSTLEFSHRYEFWIVQVQICISEFLCRFYTISNGTPCHFEENANRGPACAHVVLFRPYNIHGKKISAAEWAARLQKGKCHSVHKGTDTGAPLHTGEGIKLTCHAGASRYKQSTAPWGFYWLGSFWKKKWTRKQCSLQFGHAKHVIFDIDTVSVPTDKLDVYHSPQTHVWYFWAWSFSSFLLVGWYPALLLL